MLNHISPLISPELLKVLSEMGHGDEIVLADANFPSASIAARTTLGHELRADGIGAAPLLDAILELFPLDQYDAENFILMEVVPGDTVQTPIWDTYADVLHAHEPNNPVTHLERFAYYERAKQAYAVVSTGETALYANLILKKGVVKG
ncbi:MAG: L-fucose mutarotase [Lachnospiraceae bacterium]|nr:L-fucose mutarotase [Lachnospiraceae bacterium]